VLAWIRAALGEEGQERNRVEPPVRERLHAWARGIVTAGAGVMGPLRALPPVPARL
jgi:hypothetical protein